jgi:hypothetical protein
MTLQGRYILDVSFLVERLDLPSFEPFQLNQYISAMVRVIRGLHTTASLTVLHAHTHTSIHTAYTCQ